MTFRGRLRPSLGVEAVLTVPFVPADQPGQLADLAVQPVKLTVRGVEGVLLPDDPVGEVAATPWRPARCPLQLGLIQRQAPAPLHLLLPEPVPLRLELLELRACGSVLGEFLPRLLAGPGPRDLGRVAVALLRPLFEISSQPATGGCWLPVMSPPASRRRGWAHGSALTTGTPGHR